MKQMLQAANTNLLNPLVPNAHNSDCQNLPFPLQIRPVCSKSVKTNLRIFIFCTLSAGNAD